MLSVFQHFSFSCILNPPSTLTRNGDAVNGSHIGHLPRCTAIKLLKKPTRKRKRIGRFLYGVWKTVKGFFCCCCHSCAVDVVEPFVPPADLEPEPDPDTSSPDPDPSSPAPDLSDVEPNNESFESLYKAREMIGCGAFGSVAIKRMRKFDNFLYLDIPGHPEPLITEVALLLMMRREPISPYVIQLYEWFEHPRKFTLIMELPEPCESLPDFITRFNPEVCETVARVFMRQAVLAVHHCIEHGVFHNDIQAQNFLLKRNSLDLKLIDFGCGQLFSSEGYESDVYVATRRQTGCSRHIYVVKLSLSLRSTLDPQEMSASN
ncbi:unnamed protein product [Leuciscus chuanchicus]